MSVTTEVVPSLAPTCAEMDSNVCPGAAATQPTDLGPMATGLYINSNSSHST
jgi:hypothetical protein